MAILYLCDLIGHPRPLATPLIEQCNIRVTLISYLLFSVAIVNVIELVLYVMIIII